MTLFQQSPHRFLHKLTILPILILISIFNVSCVTKNTIETRVGEVVNITLESNGTTGYGWRIAGTVDEDVLQPAGSEYVPDKVSPMIVGAGGREIWMFKALKKGRAKLYFEYARPWEKDVPAVKKEAFVIVVK